jgi:hypothetical protein
MKNGAKKGINLIKKQTTLVVKGKMKECISSNCKEKGLRFCVVKMPDATLTICLEDYAKEENLEILMQVHFSCFIKWILRWVNSKDEATSVMTKLLSIIVARNI